MCKYLSVYSVLCLLSLVFPQVYVQAFDSTHDIISADAIKQICCSVRSKRSKIRIDIMDIHKLTETKDCGLYALANAMQPHLIKCLKDPIPSPFPFIHRDMLHGDIKETKLLVSLRCSRRLPEDHGKRMIQCVHCYV